MNKVTYEFDPFELVDVDPPKSAARRREALEEIAEFIKTESLNYIGDGKTPVAGGSWKRTLSKEYRERKIANGGAGFANMELEGDLLDSLDAYPKKDKIVYGVEGKEAPKADGHNNFSGKSQLPPREFVPNSKKGQTFRREIVRGIREIAEEFAEDGE